MHVKAYKDDQRSTTIELQECVHVWYG